MRRHNRALYRAARAILRNDAAAEDAVQEAWLHAYRAMHSFRAEARLSTWLMRIAMNEALAIRRKTAPGAEPQAEPALPAHEEPEAIAAEHELHRLLEHRIAKLPAALRTVFVLRATHEHSVREVATILCIPEATVKTRFFRARRRLRLALSTLI
jgi:RNA polymerase sigma-70 factor (ECF subfamily)